MSGRYGESWGELRSAISASEPDLIRVFSILVTFPGDMRIAGIDYVRASSPAWLAGTIDRIDQLSHEGEVLEVMLERFALWCVWRQHSRDDVDETVEVFLGDLELRGHVRAGVASPDALSRRAGELELGAAMSGYAHSGGVVAWTAARALMTEDAAEGIRALYRDIPSYLANVEGIGQIASDGVQALDRMQQRLSEATSAPLGIFGGGARIALWAAGEVGRVMDRASRFGDDMMSYNDDIQRRREDARDAIEASIIAALLEWLEHDAREHT